MLRTRLALAAVALLGAAPLAAQNTCTGNPCQVTHTASVTVNDVMRLTVAANTTDLGTPVEADYDALHKDASGPTATVKSNRPWHIDVVGATSKFSFSNNSGNTLTDPNKSAADLLWGTVSGTYGSNMGASASFASGNGTASTAKQIFFRTNWSYAADVPGQYSLVVNFTLAAP